MMIAGRVCRGGLVATNSIRGGANRAVLDHIRESLSMFNVFSDEPWVLDGAAVRVSLICFATKDQALFISLDDRVVSEIRGDLTSDVTDLTCVNPLEENALISFIGVQKNGTFDITGDLARNWLCQPANVNGRKNADVLKPWVNGSAITGRNPDKWIIDFGVRMTENEASFYQLPFEYVVATVKPTRQGLRRNWHRTRWWLFGDPRPAMRTALATLSKFIITPRVAKHRIFQWQPTAVLPDSATVAISREDDTVFGVLHSRFHELWALRLGTSLEDRPRYTPSTTFETFPFPEGMTPNIPATDYADDPRAQRVTTAARRLNELREAWLNPPDLVVRVPEVVLGYPDRILPKNDEAAAILKKRTLTNLYNERPAWLANVHRDLDEAVAAAYGWPADLSDEEILARLFALNQERTSGKTQLSSKKGGGSADLEPSHPESDRQLSKTP